MLTDEAPVATDSQSGPTSDAQTPSTSPTAPESTAAPQSAAEQGATSAKPPADPDAEARARWLAEADPDEILRVNRKLAGKIGSEADRLAQKRIAERQAADEARRKEEEFDRLLADSPLEAAEKMLAERQSAKQAQGTWGEVDVILNGLFETLPGEVQTTLRGKPYYGTPAQARAEYLRDLVEALGEHKSKKATADFDTRLKAAVDKARREAREAGAKDVLADANAADSPDTGGGNTPSADAMGQDEFNGIRNNLDALRDPKVKARVNKGLALGLIRH